MPQDRRQFLQRFFVGSLLVPAMLKNPATMLKHKEQQSFNAGDMLNIVASKNSSSNDFDFLVGQWRINNRKLKTRLNNCQEWEKFEDFGNRRKILSGLANIDDFRTDLNRNPSHGRATCLTQ